MEHTTRNDRDLIIACFNRDVKIAKLIAATTPDLELTDRVLSSACAGGEIRIVYYLVKTRRMKPGPQHLNFACEYNNLDVVRFLIGLNYVKASNQDLEVACKYGHKLLVHYLITEAGMNPTWSAVSIAADSQNWDICKLLVDHQAIGDSICQFKEALKPYTE